MFKAAFDVLWEEVWIHCVDYLKRSSNETYIKEELSIEWPVHVNVG
jgi:hypothetical protein